jgi:nicotinamide-nucleotide amidase
MLGVRHSTLEQHGAVSEMTVREMVAGALLHSSAQVAMAVSGIAGPDGGTAEKPVGTVWFAWGLKDGEIRAQRMQLDGNRSEVRAQAVKIALQGIANLLNNRTETA